MGGGATAPAHTDGGDAMPPGSSHSNGCAITPNAGTIMPPQTHMTVTVGSVDRAVSKVPRGQPHVVRKLPTSLPMVAGAAAPGGADV